MKKPGASSSSSSARGASADLGQNTPRRYQRTSWYGAVPLGAGVRSNVTARRRRLAAGAEAGGIDGGSLGSSNPAVVKAATAGHAPLPAMKKPFKEPASGDGGDSLDLPRQTSVDAVAKKKDDDDAKTKAASDDDKSAGAAHLTRLLRTPLSGGVLNSMKDADLPTVAVAARNLMELADYADLSTIMSNMNHRRCDLISSHRSPYDRVGVVNADP